MKEIIADLKVNSRKKTPISVNDSADKNFNFFEIINSSNIHGDKNVFTVFTVSRFPFNNIVRKLP